MKSEKISFNFKRDFDRFDALLLSIPVTLFVCDALYKWIPHIYVFIVAFPLAMTYLPAIATNYCYREDRTRFEKGLFIFLSFCSLLIVVYYFCISGQPAMDTFVKWMGNILFGISWLLTIVFFSMWSHKYKQLSASNEASKITKCPIEWPLMLLLFESVLWVK